MQQWEFTSLFTENDHGSEKLAYELQKMGNIGWQVVQVESLYEDGSGTVVLLQRPKSDLIKHLCQIVSYYYETGGVSRHLIDKLDEMIDGE